MGTTRPAPTASEILVVLGKVIPKGKGLGYYFALNSIRRELKTTSKKAAEWLELALQEEPHEFELLGTVSGRAWHVSRSNGTFLRLDQAGYAEVTDESYWPMVTELGAFVSKEGDAGDREFVVLSKDLRAACKRAASARRAGNEARRKSQEASERGAEERHGESLAYFRGLLKMAGVEVGSDSFRAGYSHSFTSLNVTLMDGAIDAVANVLAANGIEPDPPTQIVTRKPLQEATE